MAAAPTPAQLAAALERYEELEALADHCGLAAQVAQQRFLEVHEEHGRAVADLQLAEQRAQVHRGHPELEAAVAAARRRVEKARRSRDRAAAERGAANQRQQVTRGLADACERCLQELGAFRPVCSPLPPLPQPPEAPRRDPGPVVAEIEQGKARARGLI